MKMAFAVAMAGVIGGIVGAAVTMQFVSTRAVLQPAMASTVRLQESVSASRIELRDANGRVRAELAMSADGGPGLFFFDTAGKNRMVLGLYSPAEGEAPSVVLNDPQQRAAGIFRLFGSRDTPVVVLKNQGRERSIYGLDPTSTDPFLANYGGDGAKNDVFGHY